jgi:flagellar motor switch protein FliG
MPTATLRKAAVFLASLPEPQAAKLLATLSPEQAAAVSAEIALIGDVAGEEQEAVLCEFAAAEPLDFEEAPIEASAAKTLPFEFLHGLDTSDLLSLFGDEHPQTVALILSQLPAEQAAAAVSAFTPDRQTQVLNRIAKMSKPSEEIIAEVADALRRRLAGPVSVPISTGMTRVVKMFGSMRPVAERKVLSGIAEADPDLLHAIRCAILGPDVASCGEWTFTGAAC